MATVTVIPAIKKNRTTVNETIVSHLKVAAYARVSTDQDEQLTSYEAQVEYYTDYIKRNPNWQFVGIFSDEGITGTNTKKRNGFNRMIELALSGKIDLILTKSISRFARNTVDTLQTVRKLKASGVEVIFEKENLHTFDPKCEIMLTIMSSLAQEESRSISENVRWGKQKSMQDGKINLSYSHFLGYKKGKNGRPEIVEEEAVIVRRIYQLFLDGKGMREIARTLTDDSIPTPFHKKNWHCSTIRSILTNEKYKGDALLQKYYVADYLTKECRKNKGEKKQYYIKDSHPAIIDEATFDRVQELLEKNKKTRTKLVPASGRTSEKTSRKVTAGTSKRLSKQAGTSEEMSGNTLITVSEEESSIPLFYGQIICGQCGELYRPHERKHKGNSSYYWYCKNKYKHDRCSTPIIKENKLKNLIVPILKEHDYKYPRFSAERWQRFINRIIINSDNTATVILKDQTEREIPLA